MTLRLSFFCLLFPFLLVGCGPSAPKDFPKLVRPVTVKLHKGGEPLKDVTILLTPKEQAYNCYIGGDIGPDGVAALSTSRGTYTKPGVPAGKYRVQLTEALRVDIVPFPMTGTEQQQAAWTKEYDTKLDAMRTFPKILADPDKTPLEIEVVSSPVAVEFDVSQY